MAFGKKKDEAPAPGADDSNPGGEIEPLFPADEGSDENEDAAEALAASEPVAAAPAPVEAAAAAPDATDSLLSMFQAGDDEETDRSVIVELAGDVDLPDLLEELHTLAAAMGIRV